MRRIKKIGPFKSKFEATVSKNIQSITGSVPPYEPQTYKFKVPITGSKGICLACGSSAVSKYSHYSPDFEIGVRTFIEAKGKFTSSNRRRLVAFSEEHPDVKICILFQRDNWLTGKHASKYSQWAKKYGFTYAIGEHPPVEWFRS